MTAKRVKNKNISVVLTVLFFALVIYFVATLISNNAKVKAQEAQINELRQTYQQQLEENENIKEQIKEAKKQVRILQDDVDEAD